MNIASTVYLRIMIFLHEVPIFNPELGGGDGFRSFQKLSVHKWNVTSSHLQFLNSRCYLLQHLHIQTKTSIFNIYLAEMHDVFEKLLVTFQTERSLTNIYFLSPPNIPLGRVYIDLQKDSGKNRY